MKRTRHRQRGQATVEYAIVLAGLLIPVTFAIIYTAELLWVWHSVVNFTRDGARYASTHCWQASGDNVVNYMKQNVPLMFDRDQFTGGAADIQVTYFSKDPDSGALTPFACDAECSTECVPDTVTVAIANYEFRNFVAYLGLPAVRIPNFQTSLPIESAGCDPEQGTCLP